jgi:hypothetical protein
MSTWNWKDPELRPPTPGPPKQDIPFMNSSFQKSIENHRCAASASNLPAHRLDESPNGRSVKLTIPTRQLRNGPLKFCTNEAILRNLNSQSTLTKWLRLFKRQPIPTKWVRLFKQPNQPLKSPKNDPTRHPTHPGKMGSFIQTVNPAARIQTKNDPTRHPTHPAKWVRLFSRLHGQLWSPQHVSQVRLRVAKSSSSTCGER